jgi:ATP-dependent RNA helicase DeaD
MPPRRRPEPGDAGGKRAEAPDSSVHRNDERSATRAAAAPKQTRVQDRIEDRARGRTDQHPPRSHHREEHDERPQHRRDHESRAPRHERETHREHSPRVPDKGFETFRIEVGHDHGVKPGNIVGAIANEAGLDSKYIGRVDIQGDHSYVDLPSGMPSEIFKHLKKVWVSGQQLRITRGGEEPEFGKPRKPKGPPSFKPKPVGGFDRPKRASSKKHSSH